MSQSNEFLLEEEVSLPLSAHLTQKGLHLRLDDRLALPPDKDTRNLTQSELCVGTCPGLKIPIKTRM